jgi:hypothetical protein
MKAPSERRSSQQQHQASDHKLRYLPIKPAVKKMMALIRPTIHSSLPGPLMPSAWWKVKLAPLDPV